MHVSCISNSAAFLAFLRSLIAVISSKALNSLVNADFRRLSCSSSRESSLFSASTQAMGLVLCTHSYSTSSFFTLSSNFSKFVSDFGIKFSTCSVTRSISGGSSRSLVSFFGGPTFACLDADAASFCTSIFFFSSSHSASFASYSTLSLSYSACFSLFDSSNRAFSGGRGFSQLYFLAKLSNVFCISASVFFFFSTFSTSSTFAGLYCS
mmetsp:Transcript_11907/g.24152  ORF Transcript_11907/g.24152 Transcript_11907/m.24152 type:complete len:209 (+) Transcript_11907:2330-2956(+)